MFSDNPILGFLTVLFKKKPQIFTISSIVEVSVSMENKMYLWQLSSYKTDSKWGNSYPVPKESTSVLIKESGWGDLSLNKFISLPSEFSKLDCLKSSYSRWSVILILTVSTRFTTVLTSKWQIPSPKLLYLDVGNNFKGDSCKIEGVHCKIHQIPPVVYVLIESAIPHFLDFSPDKTCRKQESPLSWWGIICIRALCVSDVIKENDKLTAWKKCLIPPLTMRHFTALWGWRPTFPIRGSRDAHEDTAWNICYLKLVCVDWLRWNLF